MPRLKKLPELEKWVNQLKFYIFEVRGSVLSQYVIINSKSPEIAKKKLEVKYIDYSVFFIGQISETIIEV